MIEKYIAFHGDYRRIPMSLGCVALFYCLSGSYRMETAGGTVLLREKDLLVVNTGERIGWEAEEGSLLFKVTMEESKLQRCLKQGKVRFLLNSPEHRTRDYHALQVILDTMIRRFADQDGELSLWSLYYTLWDELRKNFLLPSEKGSSETDPLFNRLKAEIYTQFHEPLTARSMALRYGMSESAFSKWFQKKSGVRFSEFLRKIRLEYAREQLLDTDAGVTDIAFQAGFSNISVFNHSFRDYYHITPREMRRQAATVRQEETRADTEAIRQYISRQAENSCLKEQSIKRISVNAEAGFPVKRNLTNILGPMDAADLLQAKDQEAVITLAGSLSLQAVRIVNLFSHEFFADFDAGSGSVKWCFERMNLFFDFLMQYRLNAIIELSGIRSISTEKDKINLNSLCHWETTLCLFLKHMINRYTKEIVSEWCFEIRADNMITDETGPDYPFTFFTRTWDILEEYLADVKAGPGVISMSPESGISVKMAELWKRAEKKPSFISAVCHPYTMNSRGTEGSFIADRHYLRDQLQNLHEFMKDFGLDDVPIWITEWNAPNSRTALYNDTCAKGCHMIMQLTDAAEIADRVSCGFPSDWTFVSASEEAPFFGGKGLISKDGILKPFYYALHMFSFMGEKCITKGDGYYVTVRPDGYYSMLLYNPGTFSAVFHQNPEEDIKTDMLPFLYEDKNSVDYMITFKNLKSGDYSVNTFEYRSDQRSPLYVWSQLGYKKNLNFWRDQLYEIHMCSSDLISA